MNTPPTQKQTPHHGAGLLLGDANLSLRAQVLLEDTRLQIRHQ